MKVKTYGVPDLTEWHGKLKAGSLEVNVSFTGGTASPSGAQPAYFMTKDPIVQFVIENSKEYKNGFIILVMSQDIAGEHPRMAIPKPKPAPVVEAPKEPAVAPAPVPETPAPVVKEPVTPTTPAEEPPAEEAQPTGETQDETLQGDGKDADGGKIKVADKNEAIEYLKEHFAEKNYTATSLRTKTAFEAACKECGVEFLFSSNSGCARQSTSELGSALAGK